MVNTFSQVFPKDLTPKVFLNKVLSGTAVGIVVGLIPNAILGELFKFLITKNDIFTTPLVIVQAIQFTVPIIVGVLIALQFGLTAIEAIITGSAAFAASGAYKVIDGKFVLVGIGDLINTMLTAAICIVIIYLVHDKLGSMTILLLPIIAAGGAGLIGVLTLPFVSKFTAAIGTAVNSFTDLQPVIMSILISISFGIIIISPVSTVAIATAIGLDGLASGAANLGICACAMLLVVSSRKVNNSGVTWAVGLGAMKMMMPNFIKHPIITIPIVIASTLTGIAGSFLNIQGTAASAGFGFSGLVGPINAMKFMTGSPTMNLIITGIAFFVIPLISALIADFLCTKVLKLYQPDVFTFNKN